MTDELREENRTPGALLFSRMLTGTPWRVVTSRKVALSSVLVQLLFLVSRSNFRIFKTVSVARVVIDLIARCPRFSANVPFKDFSPNAQSHYQR